jgi:glycosyltransferase involved in cell wall biosynthesis
MHVLWRFDREVCTNRTCFACTIAGHRPPQLWRYTGHRDRSVKHVDAFVAPSRFTAEIYAANGFHAPFRHLPDFLPQPKPPAPSAEFEGKRPFFLFVGRLEKIKGAQALIEAFREYDKADLYIAGTGNFEPILRELAAGLGHVHFLGMLNHERLWQLYQRAVATVVPSLCYESFGIITLESWSMRTPVIVHDLGALPEVVRDGRGGLTYKSLDELRHALETLQYQPDYRQQLGEQGYQSYIERYAEEPHLKMYYDLIVELEATKQELNS